MIGLFVMGLANGALVGPEGQSAVGWVKTYDPEGNFGRGDIELTDDPRLALQFATTLEAYQTWRAVPRNRPRRPDGKANRPLTAFTVLIREIPEKE